ncbi:hypothetical protein J2S70_001422 [Trueperella bonasi]|uniref:Uncharacterized protein n=1 Tax=Trueperella bonasi TaxID=312286 RepID=A0ABT9NHG2_9ACTO|nr:hypothetical protein [Trueperella bonasi]MDP9806840.1 hypothetical protein [Trueperella bonasi]
MTKEAPGASNYRGRGSGTTPAGPGSLSRVLAIAERATGKSQRPASLGRLVI